MFVQLECDIVLEFCGFFGIDVSRDVLSAGFYSKLPVTVLLRYTGLSKKMDGIWNRYNLKSTGRIYAFGVLKCSEKFKVLDLP